MTQLQEYIKMKKYIITSLVSIFLIGCSEEPKTQPTAQELNDRMEQMLGKIPSGKPNESVIDPMQGIGEEEKKQNP